MSKCVSWTISSCIVLCLLALAAAGCDIQSTPESSGDITAFDFKADDNPQLKDDVHATITGNTVTVELPAGTDVRMLVPTITFAGASIEPRSSEAQDFTTPVEYRVTASDGSSHAFSVVVKVPAPTSKDITAFKIGDVSGAINGTSITLALPYGTDVTALAPDVQHDGESIHPESGAAQDFSSPVTYTVTASDGSTKSYTVTVSVMPSNAKDITSFKIGNATAQIQGDEITLTVPFGTDVGALEPTITSTGASVEPASGRAQDFHAPVTYTVVAANGSTHRYTVIVSVAPSDAKSITQFAIQGSAGTIRDTTIDVMVPFGTDVAHLMPMLMHTGQSIRPDLDATVDFTQPVMYRVTAADGSTKDYTVIVHVAASSAKDITAFSIQGLTAAISGNSITLTLPYGSDRSALMPTVVHTGQALQPASGTPQNFSSPVQYKVTAADGSMRSYTVTVNVALSSAKEITYFQILGHGGQLSGDAISVTLPFGTDVTMLQPTISHTGDSISPASGQAQSFSSPVTYTVTAANGSTRNYAVTVQVAPSSSKELTAFSIMGAQGQITGNNISVTVPFGTSVSALQPVIIHTGATILPASGTARNFNQPVVYVVSAADGSTRSYTVTVNVAPSTAKEIARFRLLGVDGQISGTNIAVTLPYGSDVTSLMPTIEHTGASIDPSAGTARNFSSAVTYTVTAADSSTREYTVTVSVALNGTKDITSLSIVGVPGQISGNVISLTVPYGTSRSALSPTIAITGASVSPASGVAKDFNSPVTYTVTADDGSTKQYTVTVNVALNSAKDISAFSILGVPGQFNGNAIALTVPYGTNPSALTPTIAITGASVSPANGAPRDLSHPVTYTVTADDGTTKQYTVTVNVALNSAKDLTSFSILGVPGQFNGNAIALTLPYGTNPSSLTPTVAITGASVSPASGVPRDFSSAVTYTVTADDGSTKQYTVTVSVALNSAKDITSFSILGVPGQFSGSAIGLTVPYGTNRMSLTPTVAISGETVSPASGVAQDFTNPVTYTVTAQNGTTKQYTVNVTAALNSAKDITSFSILGVPGQLNGNTISLTVPYGSDAMSLTPTIGITGASVSPASSVSQDFRSPVTYTVTADDGTTKQYTVTVNVALNSAKDIDAFSILGVSGQFAGSSIGLTVPYGTNRASLTPTIGITGATVSPASGVATDFTHPVTYTVTADDGSTKQYTVTVAVALNSAKDVTSFSILGVSGQVAGTSIGLTVPYGTNPMSLTPTIGISGASVSPASGVATNFTSPVTYTVTADDGTTKQYTVTVNVALNSAKDITSFSILGVTGQLTGNAIDLTVPYGTNPSALTPTIGITGASVSPASGVATDFTHPVTYTVTADDSTTKQYTVTVHVALNSAKDINTFSILGVSGNVSSNSVTLTVPYGSNKASLTPTITISGATVSPASGVASDFTNPVTYTVTADDGTTKDYTVTVTVALNSAKDITSFSILGVSGNVGSNTITLTVPYGTNPSALTPTIATSGVSVSPASGVTKDFSSPVTYTVTAQDGTTKQYTVTVTVALNSAKDITAFSLMGLSGTIGANTVSVTVPYNTTVTSLAPTISISGVSVSPAAGVAQSFSSPVTYTVTAQDSSTKQYTVTVTQASASIDCRDQMAAFPSLGSGTYTVDPDGAGSISPFAVYCDMAADGGGWTLIGKTAAGDYSSMSDSAFVALIANPISDVNPSLLLNASVPTTGQIAFWNRAKTNALYNASGARRAIRVVMSNHQLVPGNNGTYFQQRVSAPVSWDFWAAMRNSLLWNRDQSTYMTSFINYFGTDVTLTGSASDFNTATNTVTHNGDGTMGFFATYTHTLNDGTSLTVSRHMGLLDDGYNNQGYQWLLTADPTDGRWKNDTASLQRSLIWMR